MANDSPVKEHKWTIRQLKYLDNLVKGMKQAPAYTAAGFKSRGPAIASNAYRLANQPWFKKVLNKRMKKASYKADITAERVLLEEKAIAFLDPNELFEAIECLFGDGKPKYRLRQIPDMPAHVRRAISSYEEKEDLSGEVVRKIKFQDKGKSLERISKHLGMYQDGAWVLNVEFVKFIIELIPDDTTRDRLKQSILTAAAEQHKLTGSSR